MENIRVALAGNPNTGKTTLFNKLTGSNQYVGNWPGVTVEKKEGKLRADKNVTITDLPGVYSLAPNSPEEVVARKYLINEKPDLILNIIDGTSLERNLYLTTQLLELSIPMVVAINMYDVVEKRGDEILIEELSKSLGCPVVKISALKGRGIDELSNKVIETVKAKTVDNKQIRYEEDVETALERISNIISDKVDNKYLRWYEIKVLEKDEKVLEELTFSEDEEKILKEQYEILEKTYEDDTESIIINERYNYVTKVIDGCYKKIGKKKLSTSEKIDKVVTNRILALPIFAAIMYLVYFLSITTVGTFFTDWVNDGVFKDGWHLFGVGSKQYEAAMDEYATEKIFDENTMKIVKEAEEASVVGASEIYAAMEEGSFKGFEEAYETYSSSLEEAGYDISENVTLALESEEVPSPENYGIFVPSIPTLAENGLDAINTAPWLKGLIVDGIIGGVGAVLGFLPQMIVLFILLAFLEACGYMARIAFVLDRIFRRFGLSGKSFIPILIGTGCGVPGVMASRTIENENDRRMTILTTTFIPCSAKLPIIALISAALFKGAWWVAPSAYFLGMGMIIISGIILKKTKPFSGNPIPFIMELPAYHWPTVSNIARSVWERTSSFIKKAGTVILLASIVIWAGSKFGMMDGSFTFSPDMELETSVIGYIGNAISVIFEPLGFANIKATIATLMGLVAKEEVVGVFGVLDFAGMTPLAAYSFLAFNLLCAPCFAAIGAIKREMSNAKWTWFAILYQCGLAYVVSLIIYQFGIAFKGEANPAGLIVAIFILAVIIYMLFRPTKKYTVNVTKKRGVRWER